MKSVRSLVVTIIVACLSLVACSTQEQPQVNDPLKIPAAYKQSLIVAAATKKVSARLLGAIVLTENHGIWPADPYPNPPEGTGATGAFKLVHSMCPPGDAIIFAKAANCAADYLANAGYTGSLTDGDYAFPSPGTVAGALATYCGGLGYVNALKTDVKMSPYRECIDQSHDGVAYYQLLSGSKL